MGSISRTPQVEQTIADFGGDPQGECTDLPRDFWKQLVSTGETRHGYWELVTEDQHPGLGQDEILSSHALEVISNNGGSIWNVYPGIPPSDWIEDVENGDTMLGYWEYVIDRVTASLRMVQSERAAGRQ